MLYFAYGSNMQTATFRGRRRIEFTRAFAARAPGWRVTLDKPPLIPIGESFANLLRDPDATALGVVYEVTEADVEHLELTEGVPIGNYHRTEIAIVPLVSTGPSRTAITLVSERRDSALRPSRRYMACLIAGAEEHGLPAEYVAALRAIPAGDESEEARRLRPEIDRFLRNRGGAS